MKRTLGILPIATMLVLALLPASPTVTGARRSVRSAEPCHTSERCKNSLEGSPKRRSDGCVGKKVRAGADLSAVSASKPAGTTFCLAAGLFTIAETVAWQPGDRVIGAGMHETFIRPAGIGEPVVGFYAPGNATNVKFARFDIGEFQADPASTTCRQCGTAIVDSGQDAVGWITVASIRCHDNGTVCIGAGWGNIRATRLNCYRNGFHDRSLLDPTYRSSSCVKMSRGSMTMRDSWIHDNFWNGVWCDYCDHTTWIIENNVFTDNGHAAVQWEISGELATDTAVVRNNVIQDNGWQLSVLGSFTSAGLIVSGGRNITVEGNIFGGNRHLDAPDGTTLVCCRGILIGDDDRAPWEPNLQNVVIGDNVLNGDSIVGCSYEGVTCSENRN